MIKAIVFDFSGVLFTGGKSVTVEKLVKEYNYDKEIIVKVLSSEKNKKLKKGLISEKDFLNWIQNNLPAEYDPYLIKKEYYNSYVLNNDVFDLIKKLKERYKIGAFSVNTKGRIELLDKKYDFRRYFDTEVYSFEHHLNKPDKKLVEIMVKKINHEPREIVYIDDAETNILPARDMGIKTILYSYSKGNVVELQRELKRFGVEC